MNKIEVGQKIYTLNVGNAARGCEQVLTERVVSKVGRKYFYFNEYGREVKFDKETLSEFSEYTSDYKVYLKESDYEDEKEYYTLLRGIRDKMTPAYGTPSISLEKARAIAAILGEVYD